MAEAENTETSETTATGGDTSASGTEATTTEAKFTQADLDKHAGRRAAEAKRAATKELADKLGCTVEEAAAKLAKLAEQEEAEKTEVQRAQEALAAAQREVEEAKAAASTSEFEKSLYKKLSAAGVGWGCEDEEADRRMGMARSILTGLGITQESSAEDIAEKIAVAKGDVPGLFTAKTEAGTAPSGVTNGRPPAGGQGTQNAMERGRAKARALRPDPEKQTDPFSGPAFRRVG